MECISLNEIKDKLSFFNKMYDAVRLVDPERKKVIDYRGPSTKVTQEVCYDYWGKGKICDNCISVRAYYENKSFIKLENNDKAIFLVTAIPVEREGMTLVLELLKNATDTMLIGSGEYSEGELLSRFVEDINDKLVKDPLTSLYNRRFIDERLPADIIESVLDNTPFSLCFMDIDRLKSLNDLYGHEAGDWAIKAVGEVLLSHIPPEKGWSARYGGDEFLFCLKNTDEKSAREIAEGIQSSIENMPMCFQCSREKPVNLSVSFGMETMKENSLTAKELIRLANYKMHEVKKYKSRGEI